MARRVSPASLLFTQLRVVRDLGGTEYEYEVSNDLEFVPGGSDRIRIRVINTTGLTIEAAVRVLGEDHLFTDQVSKGTGKLDGDNHYYQVVVGGPIPINGTGAPAPELQTMQFNARLGAKDVLVVEGTIRWQDSDHNPRLHVDGTLIPGEQMFQTTSSGIPAPAPAPGP